MFIKDEEFVQPKPRRKTEGLIGPPPKKKRKAPAVEEVTFDHDARKEFLTGFHKRKLQRQKLAQEAVALREKQEKAAFRKQLREERQRQVEEHVRQVESLLATHDIAGAVDETEEWNGIPSDDDAQKEEQEATTPLAPSDPIIDIEEEYIDEDRFTTVKVESVTITHNGLEKPGAEAEAVEKKRQAVAEAKKKTEEEARKKAEKKSWPKKDKNKFRYENKIERSLNRAKARNKAKRAKFTNKG